MTVANETTAPAGVSFSAPTTKASGLAMGANLAAQNVKAYWVRRTATNSAAVNNASSGVIDAELGNIIQ